MNIKTNKLFLILSFLIVFLVLVQLFLSNSLITDGSKLEELQVQIDNLEEENNHLKSQAASLFSLSKLNETAEKKGFTQPSKIVNLSSKLPVAARSTED